MALQNPYSHAIGKFRGKPIRAESRRIFAAVTSLNPSLTRLDGIHCWNPYCTIPIPTPSSRRIMDNPTNSLLKSWANRLFTCFSTFRSESSPSTTPAPYRCMMARASSSLPCWSRNRGDSGMNLLSSIRINPVGRLISHSIRHPNRSGAAMVEASQLVMM